MGSFSLTHWIIIGVVVLVLFGGGGKISSLMGDFAKGLKSFKKTMSEDEPSQQDLKAQQPPIAPPQNTVQVKDAGPKEANGKDASMVEEVSSQSPR